MSRIDTKLTRLLGTSTPVVAAPMAGASGGALAAAVNLGGGFGFLSAARTDPECLRHELTLARSLLQIDPLQPLPIGVGFLSWVLEKPNSPDLELLSTALNSKVKAIWFSFGHEIGRWVQLVRDHDHKSGNTHKTLVFVQISSVEEALVAAHDWKVDVIVAQGIEAGGHGHSAAPPLLTLIPAITAVLPNDSPILLAAGGLSQGTHVASLLTLGASGVVLGTRFLLSPESLYSDIQKQTLISNSSTVRSMVFDRVKDTHGWPAGIDGRALHNLTVEDFENGASLEELKTKYSPEDPSRVVVWSGTGVALMSVIKPAKEIVQELHQSCLERLKAAQLLTEFKPSGSEL